jgi:hypothetical protein
VTSIRVSERFACAFLTDLHFADDVERLVAEAKKLIMEKALRDNDYRTICKLLSSGRNLDKEYRIHNEILCWKNRVYVLKGLRKSIIEAEHDSKVAGHFGRERSMELTT